MLGLKRGTVRLLPHNPGWKNLFEKEKERLNRGLKDLIVDIEHIGSTAIPGIAAKPIIDMAIGVRSIKEAKKLKKPLQKLGYTFRSNASSRLKLFFTKGPEARRTHYIHVLKSNGILWKNDIGFRNYLRKHKTKAKKYEWLKRKLADLYAGDRKTYTASKDKFIQDTIKLSRKYVNRSTGKISKNHTRR